MAVRRPMRRWTSLTVVGLRISMIALHFSGLASMPLMSVYFCPHSVFNFGYLIEFMCLKSDLIDNSDN